MFSPQIGLGLVRKDGKVAGSTDGNVIQGNVNEIVICSRYSSIVVTGEQRIRRISLWYSTSSIPEGRNYLAGSGTYTAEA
jgi:hypothetical protein